MLQEAQRTSAPSAFSVSMSTAVWMVMWSDPAIRAPRRGCRAAYSSRMATRAGISLSAMAISLRPHSARERSATWKSEVCCGLLVDAALIAPPFCTGKGFASAVVSFRPSLASASRARCSAPRGRTPFYTRINGVKDDIARPARPLLAWRDGIDLDGLTPALELHRALRLGPEAGPEPAPGVLVDQDGLADHLRVGF